MFITFNNKAIYKINKSPFKIGWSPDSDILLVGRGIMGSYAQIVKEHNRDFWRLEIVGNTQVVVNQRRLLPLEKYRIEHSDYLKIENNSFQILASKSGGEISQKLDERIFELEGILHGQVLDTLKRVSSNFGMSDPQLVKRIIEEIDIKLSEVSLERDLEFLLVIKALKKECLDRIQGINTKNKSGLTHLNDQNPNYKNKLIQYIQAISNCIQLNQTKDYKEKQERIEILLPWVIQSNIISIPADFRRELAIEFIKQELLEVIFGLGPLQDLMESHDINDIMVLPSGKIYVDRAGQMEDTGRKMLTPDVSSRIIERITSNAGRRIDKTSPLVDAKVSDGSRLNAVIEPIAVGGPSLTIRRFSTNPFTTQDLVERGTLTQISANFLKACVLARKNIVVSGGTGSGKTTLLNALSSFIPDTERIVTIEDTAELKLTQDHIVALQARPANLEGKNAIPIRHLVRNALRMRPDRIVVGECRGGETLDMLQAMNTGHDGSLTTIHANSSEDAVRRIEVMSMEAEGIDLPSRAIREQISSAVDLIVQIERFAKGHRKIISITEVVGFDEEDGTIITEDIFRYRKHKMKQKLGTYKQLAFTGYVPLFIEDLIDTKLVSVEDLF